MNNIIAFLLFQFFGLGIFTLTCSLGFLRLEKAFLGTAVFFGFWSGMLLIIVVAMLFPKVLHLDCYAVGVAGLIGILILIFQRKVSFVLSAEYLYVLLTLLPFIPFIKHMPSFCDEYNHWLYLPKIYVTTHEFTTAPLTSGIGYTPLWALQGAFFQFFIPGPFDESLFSVLKIGVLFSFLFFIKESLKLSRIGFLIFAFSIVFLTSKFNKHLLVEFPLYILITSIVFLVYLLSKDKKRNHLFFLMIATLSLYMVKKSMLLIFPPIVYFMWQQNFRKELFYFSCIFSSFVLAWKIETLGLPELLASGKTIGVFFSFEAYHFYKVLWGGIQQNILYFMIFVLSMFVIYKESRPLFTFYVIFSSLFFIGLTASYILSFSAYEALRLASFSRYLSSIFYPAYTVSLYFLILKFLPKIERSEAKLNPKILKIGVALIGLPLGLSFFVHGVRQTQKDFEGRYVSKIRASDWSLKGNVYIIDASPKSYTVGRWKYHFYPHVKDIGYLSYEQLRPSQINGLLNDDNLIVVREIDERAQGILEREWKKKLSVSLPFCVYKNQGEIVICPL